MERLVQRAVGVAEVLELLEELGAHEKHPHLLIPV